MYHTCYRFARVPVLKIHKLYAHAFSFSPGSKQRKKLLESLLNKGDWQHNIKVLEEGNGEIVTWRQPTEKASVQDYLPWESEDTGLSCLWYVYLY